MGGPHTLSSSPRAVTRRASEHIPAAPVPPPESILVVLLGGRVMIAAWQSLRGWDWMDQPVGPAQHLSPPEPPLSVP